MNGPRVDPDHAIRIPRGIMPEHQELPLKRRFSSTVKLLPLVMPLLAPACAEEGLVRGTTLLPDSALRLELHGPVTLEPIQDATQFARPRVIVAAASIALTTKGGSWALWAPGKARPKGSGRSAASHCTETRWSSTTRAAHARSCSTSRALFSLGSLYPRIRSPCFH